jgi:hypothetical protein
MAKLNISKTPSGATITTTEPVFTLTETDTGALHQYGAAFAAAFAAVDLNVAKIQGDAADLAALLLRLGCDKSYPAYQAARLEFIAGTPTDKSAEARTKMWERAYAAARECKAGEALPRGGPKSAEPAAVQKAGQRSKHAEKIEELKAIGTPAELHQKAAAALKAGDASAASDILEAAKKKQAEIDKAARDAVANKTEPLAKAAREAIARMLKAGDVKGLQAVATVALKHSPAPKAEAAK